MAIEAAAWRMTWERREMAGSFEMRVNDRSPPSVRPTTRSPAVEPSITRCPAAAMSVVASTRKSGVASVRRLPGRRRVQEQPERDRDVDAGRGISDGDLDPVAGAAPVDEPDDHRRQRDADPDDHQDGRRDPERSGPARARRTRAGRRRRCCARLARAGHRLHRWASAR